MHNGNRIAAIMPLLYGLDFLEDAIASVFDVVDEIHIVYSPFPCHGAKTSPYANPDSGDALIRAAFKAGKDKIRWHEMGQFQYEGQQFEYGMAQAVHCPIYIKLDADEIWYPGLLRDVIDCGMEQRVKEVRVKMRHYWRSLTRAACHDPAAPGRVYLKMFSDGEATYSAPPEVDETFRIHHFGYAQKPDLIQYKMSIHGHQGEWRRDCNWFEDIFMANRDYDCHPVGSDAWQIEDVPLLPSLQQHKYAGLDLIE